MGRLLKITLAVIAGTMLASAESVIAQITKAEASGNDKKAVQLSFAACQNKNAYACTILGLHYRDGYGIEANSRKAKHYFEVGCSMGDGIGCSYEGLMYDSGVGVKRSKAKAKRLFRRSCKLGCQAGCDNLRK